jgi:signal peptidase II
MNVTRGIGFAVAALVFVIDQVTKLLVVRGLGVDLSFVQDLIAKKLGLDGLNYVQEVLPIFDLRFVPNVGVSLGLFNATNDVSRWMLVLLTLIRALLVRDKAAGDSPAAVENEVNA